MYIEYRDVHDLSVTYWWILNQGNNNEDFDIEINGAK